MNDAIARLNINAVAQELKRLGEQNAALQARLARQEKTLGAALGRLELLGRSVAVLHANRGSGATA